MEEVGNSNRSNTSLRQKISYPIVAFCQKLVRISLVGLCVVHLTSVGTMLHERKNLTSDVVLWLLVMN